MEKPDWRPLQSYREYPEDEMVARAKAFTADIKRRRTVRDYADRPVPREVLEQALLAAGSAPSGANLQPWHFSVITDRAVKHRVRVLAEEEERDFYNNRAPEEWLEALSPLGTDEHKGFLEAATLIAIFAQRFGQLADGRRVKHYYVPESVGIATGFLIAALHNAGLVTLTHTPSPMGFLNEICGRPDNEKPYILLVTGYPTDDCVVPAFGGTRKDLADYTNWL
ncbi:MAG: nitroreductase family protein [Alphaproteobacteria bacterium]